MTSLHVLRLSPILKEKIWGGRRLARWNKPLPPGALIGESWELVDLDATSTSGGGGGEARTRVAQGPLAGRTIRDLMAEFGPALMGSLRPTAEGGFPLLVKYLDASQHLSVQTHPSPAYLAAHPGEGAHLKTECWYVLESERDLAAPASGEAAAFDGEAVIFKGFREGLTRAEIERHVRDGTIVGALGIHRARPGECHNLPSGTCHALGAGVLVAEVQTPSDTTFRLYDWEKEYGRLGRKMHVAQGLESLEFGAPPEPRRRAAGERTAVLVDTPFYRMTEVRLEAGESLESVARAVIARGVARRPLVLLIVEGLASIGDGASRAATAERGSTWLLPASLLASVRVSSAAGATLLCVEPSPEAAPE